MVLRVSSIVEPSFTFTRMMLRIVQTGVLVFVLVEFCFQGSYGVLRAVRSMLHFRLRQHASTALLISAPAQSSEMCSAAESEPMVWLASMVLYRVLRTDYAHYEGSW